MKRQAVRGRGGEEGGGEFRWNWAKDAERRRSSQGEERKKNRWSGKKKGEQAESDVFLIS